MLSYLAVAFMAFQVAVASDRDVMDLKRVKRGPLYIRLPAPYSTNDTQCFDPQVDEYHDVGDFWSSPYSGCKVNTCVNINGVLNVERYSCPLVSRNVDFDKMKSENYFCRQAWGNRNKQFPYCCSSLKCKHYVEGRLMPLPEHMYPYLKIVN